MRTYSRKEIETGYDIIKDCIDYVLKRDDIKFISSEIAPNTYKGMVQYFNDHGQYLVYNGGDHGFLGQDYNVKFRALHDAMHRENNLTFSFKDEIILSEMTSREFSDIAYSKLGKSLKESYLVSDIINAEIKGQIEYYKKNKEYVSNQSKFIMEYLGE